MRSVCSPRYSASVTVSAGKDGNGLFFLGVTWNDITTIAHEVGLRSGSLTITTKVETLPA